MATNVQPKLTEFADWIRSFDEHAEHHLRLLERAEQVLAGRSDASPVERQALATRLERWRYQRLNQYGAALAQEDHRLLDALDLAANALAGHKPRSPRCLRQAIDEGTDLPQAAAIEACLDPKMPLDDLVEQAQRLTQERFRVPTAADPGTRRRRMLLYAPLYLSSHCVNHCVYCGFRYAEPIERKQLGPDEVLREAAILRKRGFRHVLLVAGDFPSRTTTAYFGGMLRMLAARGFQPAVEIAAQSTQDYAELRAAGACGVTLYQETYDESLYALYHPRGTKASYDWRLEALERAAEAGIPRLGLGVLLGLGQPQKELLALVRHAAYLRNRFPECTLAFSLPRITEAPPTFREPYPVDDETFVRLYCALRIAWPDVELVLSTRETAELRNKLARICITQMSAGSSTVPGGYERRDVDGSPCGQFPVSDHRAPAEVARWLRSEGFEVVWEIDGCNSAWGAT